MSEASRLDLADIQSGVLRPRPVPFAATYIILRIDDRAAGRELMRRLSNVVASAAHPESPARDTWVSAALTFQGLRALGVPAASLETFPAAFAQGMAALGWTLVSDIAPDGMLGLTGGIFNVAANLAGIITPLVIGLIVSATGSFVGALAFIGVIALIGAASYIFIVGDIKRIEL